jgi:hypothetical protein
MGRHRLEKPHGIFSAFPIIFSYFMFLLGPVLCARGDLIGCRQFRQFRQFRPFRCTKR